MAAAAVDHTTDWVVPPSDDGEAVGPLLLLLFPKLSSNRAQHRPQLTGCALITAERPGTTPHMLPAPSHRLGAVP